MPAITRSAFARPATPRLIQHAVPECGEEAYVFLRELLATDLVALRKTYGKGFDTERDSRFIYDVLARAVVDEDGKPIFASAEDAEEAFGLSLKVLERLVKACLEHSGLEVQEKNSPRQSATS